MKNIVLLGGSNSVMVNGLQKGLKEYANVTNLALGATTSIQNLYEIYRPKNQEAIQNADLIITESVINELIGHNHPKENLSLDIIFKNLQYLYATLYEFKKPVCILLLPYRSKNFQIVINMHRYLANYYGLNIVDMQSYYQNNEIIQFGNKFGPHQLSVVSRNLGKEIAKNVDCFKVSNKNLDINLPEFKILTPDNMQRNGNFKIFNPSNSMYNEIVYRLEQGNSLAINNCDGYEIIGMHSWNLENNGEITKPNSGIFAAEHCGSIHLKNINENIVKSTTKSNIFCEIQAELIIDSSLIIKFNDEKLPSTEFYYGAHSWLPNSISLPYFDLIAFFLCKPNPKMKLFDLSVIPTDIDIEIDKDIDRSYLIPDIVFFKDSMEFIDEYISHLYPNIVKHIDSVLTPQIIKKTEAQILSQLNKNTPQIQLSLEAENKILKDKIKELETNYPNIVKHIDSVLTPQIIKKTEAQILSQLNKNTPQIQLSLEAENKILKDKIKELETSYQKAIKVKNHLSYKLGQALIKANKNWYKGGYIKFIFEAMKIKKEHKNKDKSNI
ncbi:hypothetical protein [Campylobacter devanensis]|uniref:hypothetical protein n=1 Tax=Campylobacter devanensis TaxID=3161138 RepID=UPI0015D6EB19|nr:hypothetical protein [Campylobacter sp. P0088]